MIKKKKAVFLDRDGVINKERKDYVKNISELEIFHGIAELIKRLKDAGLLVIVITNQSAVNRGKTSQKNIEKIHNKIQDYLNRNETSIDGFYFCPHRPDEGCNCRKPKPGLVIKAANEFKIDLKNSWMIGDSDSDVIVAQKVGCNALKIGNSITFENAVDKILNSN